MRTRSDQDHAALVSTEFIETTLAGRKVPRQHHAQEDLVVAGEANLAVGPCDTRDLWAGGRGGTPCGDDLKEG
ncbi:hypothetical protein [uncultured Jannaschia sp.]|uniref:hypothetical protein n=1 Tax=uncultured Jannaschia sp. TaxID=293347 RepID=UPI00260C4111|nr:hypothetical protein [uncultured Jannaschia sp.]